MTTIAVQQFELFCRHVSEPLLLAAADGRLLAASRSAARLFGRSCETLKDSSLHDLLDGSSQALADYLSSCARSTGAIPGRLCLKNGAEERRLVHCQGSLLSADERGLLLLRLRSVDEANRFVILGQKIQELANEVLLRREAEAAQRALYEEAERARAAAELAVRAREEFLSIASHELRNPLNALKLVASTLHRTAVTRPERLSPAWTGAKAERALEQIVRIERLVSELLDVSRLTAGRLTVEREPVDLFEVTRAVVEHVRQQHPGQDFVLVGEAGVVGEWDAMRMEQVLLNLLTNAAKYGDGKSVTVAVARVGDEATVEVRDHGIGIAADDLGRIFERFERAVSARNHGGFGLGLWIARQIVAAHGGEITVESRPGRGSTFRVAVPLRESGGAAT